MSVHYHEITDDQGDTVDLVPFCSDWCHHEWCRAEHEPYEGWNGCHEGAEYHEDCERCGDEIHPDHEGVAA